MTDHNIGLHHQHIRKRIHEKHEEYPHPNKLKQFFDKLIFVVAIVGPIVNLPQLFKIWSNKDATGVSFISWASFSIISIVWFVYGILHKDKAIIIMFSALTIIQTLIAIGAFLYG